MAAPHQVQRIASLWQMGLWFFCVLSLFGSASSRAGEDDHESARQAFQAGEVLALPVILDKVSREFPGQVLEVELEREHGLWVYKLKLLQPGGAMVKVKANARTGEVLAARSRGIR